MAKLSRLEEVATPVVILGQTTTDEPREVIISNDQIVQVDPATYAAREARSI